MPLLGPAVGRFGLEPDAPVRAYPDSAWESAVEPFGCGRGVAPRSIGERQTLFCAKNVKPLVPPRDDIDPRASLAIGLFESILIQPTALKLEKCHSGWS